MLAVANSLSESSAQRRVFFSGQQIDEENLDLNREEVGNYVIRSFTICNFRLIIKANKPRNKER